MATAEDSPRQVSKSTRGGSKTPRTDKASSNRGETIVMALLELPVLGLMASCGVDKNVMLWDVQTGSHKGTLRGHEMGVRCMAFAMSSKVLITGGYDYKLMVLSPPTTYPQTRAPGPETLSPNLTSGFAVVQATSPITTIWQNEQTRSGTRT